VYQINQIGYDPYNATQFAADMEKEGFIMVEVRQGILTLSEPTKDVEALVLQKRIITNKNPVLTWAVSNAIARTDANENKMLDKSKARFRIDPAAAMIISHTLARIDTGIVNLNQHILSDGFGF
jgi:phage terminase large subunit-like protein